MKNVEKINMVCYNHIINLWGKKVHMKNEKLKSVLKKILIVVIAIYVIYTFFVQQETLNAYKADEERYKEQIAAEEERKQELNETKSNLDSKEYIEEVARERLDMYLPNEKVYIDISKWYCRINRGVFPLFLLELFILIFI